jgi:hypothetical protein
LKQSNRRPTMKSANFGIALLWLTVTGLTGCCRCEKAETASPTIFAPPSIVLEKGKSIQTKDGVYQPLQTELWYSQRKYNEQQDRLISALDALEQLRNRR